MGLRYKVGDEVLIRTRIQEIDGDCIVATANNTKGIHEELIYSLAPEYRRLHDDCHDCHVKLYKELENEIAKDESKIKRLYEYTTDLHWRIGLNQEFDNIYALIRGLRK